MTRPRQTITVVPVEQLTAHPANIRDDLGDLADMAQSIREHGILQPLTATEHPTREGVLLLLAGHRRLAAARQAGQDRVPVIIRHGVTDLGDQIVTMLVENTHRRDLSPVERAEAYGALRNRGMTNSEIGRATGTQVSVVTYYLTLLDLDDASLRDVREGKVKSTAAIAAVREARQQARSAGGTPARGRPKVTVRPTWFGRTHRLAATVRAACTHRDRVQVGEIACGPCWETAIRDESEQAAEQAADVDPVVVQRFLDGEHSLPTSNAERVAIVRAWLAQGRSGGDLTSLTGWKVERYALAEQAAS